MITLFERLKKHFPFLGERAVTELELFEICERRGIEVVFAHEVSRGVFVPHPTGDHIFLNAMLHGTSLLYVLSHEIAHALLHVATRTRNAGPLGFDGERCSRINHNEAENAAALLMFTFDQAQQALIDGLGANDERLDTLIKRRIYLRGKYGK